MMATCTRLLTLTQYCSEVFNSQNNTEPTDSFKLPNIPTRTEDMDPFDFNADVQNPYI